MVLAHWDNSPQTDMSILLGIFSDSEQASLCLYVWLLRLYSSGLSIIDFLLEIL